MTRSGHWRRERRCGGSKLKAYELQDPGGVDAMMLVEKPVPASGPGQVLVKLKAVTINYRDLLTVKGGYGAREKFPLVPLSDGAGVVESVGVGVTSFKAGDRVTGGFFEGWLGGEPSEEKMRSNLGGALDGVLCEYRVWPAAALVRTPDHLSDAEAASLPCAGLTAWSAVIKLGNIRSGQTVLTQGTGGVSIFALHFRKTERRGRDRDLVERGQDRKAQATRRRRHHQLQDHAGMGQARAANDRPWRRSRRRSRRRRHAERVDPRDEDRRHHRLHRRARR